jgi:hypothetical protein
MNGILAGPQKLSGQTGEYKNFFPPTGIEPRFLGVPAHSLVAVKMEMSCLLILVVTIRK